MSLELHHIIPVAEGSILVSTSRMNDTWPYCVWIEDGEVSIQLSAMEAWAVYKALAAAVGAAPSASVPQPMEKP